ncbi:MAG: protein adenylyltransferase SelO family protein, partial [Oceanococcaceae bacterium]
VAPSFVRLGNFEIHAAMGETQALRQLVDHCMQEHWPELEGDIIGWYADVCRRTAALMARWMVLGFVHGVMNTDNLSVLGLSIDYGPFGWLEPFEPDWTPNTTDAQGRRYAYGRQPQIAQWNLGCFGAALLPLGCERDALEGALRSYHAAYNTHFRAGMAARLGLASLEEEDLPWLQDWLGLLQLLKADYSLSFRRLADCQSPAALLEMLDSTRYRQEGLSEAETSRALSWFAAWQQRLEAAAEDGAQVRARMQAANPAVVPRNWMLAQAIEAAEAGDGGPLEQLMQALRQPFQEPEEVSWMERRPDWAAHKPGCSMLSCSS